MRKPMSPCYKCEFHSSTCHANCGFYQKFHDDLEEWNAIIRNGKKQLYSTRYVNYVRKIAGEVQESVMLSFFICDFFFLKNLSYLY